jgi:hypothetical protein
MVGVAICVARRFRIVRMREGRWMGRLIILCQCLLVALMIRRMWLWLIGVAILLEVRVVLPS